MTPPTNNNQEMKMLLSRGAAKEIIFRLLTGRNHRDVVVAMINAYFLDVALDFLKRVAIAKMENQYIGQDWYREHFLKPEFKSVDIATNAGTNLKTITNAMQAGTKEVVLNTSRESYDNTVKMINELLKTTDSDSEININLKIKVNKVEVELELSETLVVVNALAAKRATIRGGAWSTAGKRVEKPLMETLCRLFAVPKECYQVKAKSQSQSVDFEREVDFYLCPPNATDAKCEVKLMGRGNPESADAVIARGSKVFVADKMSDTNKEQMDSLGVLWVELHNRDRFRRFQHVLETLKIPHDRSVIETVTGDRIREAIDEVLP